MCVCVYVCVILLSVRLSCSAIHISFVGVDVSYCIVTFFVLSECVSVCVLFFLSMGHVA